MKRVKYNDFKDKVRTKAVTTMKMLDRSAPRRRPRDQGEAEILVRLAVVSWDRAISSGKLQKKGERRYSLRTDAR
ncbi:hypothetical protein [Desulforamulus aquiferis]|uniref:Transposase n=1 Tax=Desulforamulus aquiferis TaxID=1397668 RepID=A0AAW7ZBZ3_9FIRM|nr:hypothetical protein [Desulforamulus aquiferis]MDO7786912.1 hypothetical protein [Desulforamulus aquiferis]RYD03555.1 hypothetical protein N752_19300 [Desulforamulus aquiferis]